MKRSIIIFFVLVLASQVSIARSAQNLFSIGNNVNWNDPSSWSAINGGQSCGLVPQNNDSIFITSNINLNIDFTLSNGGYLSINPEYSLTSTTNKIVVTDNGAILCDGYLKIFQFETGILAQVKIGMAGKVEILNNFINNSSDISVEGALKVDGAIQNINPQGISEISGTGTITGGAFSGTGSILGISNISIIPLQSSISECTWTGSHSNEWTDPLNWSYNRLPEQEQHISILASQSFSPSITANISCNNLIINSGASIVISPEGSLTINGNLTVATSGELRVMAGTTSHGSLITKGNSDGNIIFEYNVIKNRQCDVSSPIANAQSSVFLNMYLRAYDEPSAAWGQYIIPTNVSLGVMEGFEVFSTYSDTREFIGQPNSGDYQINISASGDGWNFIGNPYPSALNWGSQMNPSNGWTKDDVYGAIYYWDNTANGNKGNYAVYCPGGNGISANGGSSVILPSQGFFVKARKSGSIHVTDDARVHSGTTGQNGNTELATLRLIANGNTMWDETVLQFNDEATSEFDGDFDAFKITANEEAPSLFTKLDDGTKVAINSLPNASLSGDIPVGFSSGKTGTYTFDVHGINTMSHDLPIYLIDTRSNTSINLRNDSSYVFEYHTSDDPMRFLLHFSSPTGISQVNLGHPSIFSTPGFINVDLGSNYSDASINIFDLNGRQIAGTNPTNQGINRIPFSGASGCYVIQVTNNTNSYTTKLWVN
jgi:hypothetical protein